MDKGGMQWDSLCKGFESKSTPEALEEFCKSTIYKDIKEFIYCTLEIWRTALEMDPEERNEQFIAKRSDSHVRGMIEVTKDMTFMLDNMMQLVLQQREDKEKEDANDEDEREENND